MGGLNLYNLTYEDIENTVYDLSEKFIFVDFRNNPNLRGEDFFCTQIGADPCELALYLLALENRFCITLDNDKLFNNEFNSFYSVMKLVTDKLLL